jgi:hypothetical protein
MGIDPKLLRAISALPKSKSIVRRVLDMEANKTIGALILGAAATAAVKKVPELLTNARPQLTKVRDWHKGPEILILGQERSGKSTLFEFLTTGRLGKEGDRTQPTKENVNSGVRTCEWMTDTGPKILGLRNIGDRRGNGPFEHAKYLVKEQPHLAFIVLDISSPEGSFRLNESFISWFDYFCTYLNEDLINRTNRKKRLYNKLQDIIIILNKIDLLDPEISTEKIDRATKFIATK